ncbi:tetratricopeptide repeat protein [Chitinasiproducens palmae]|nr:tetratricopeptide repeat protein [Chitinasiproducens palmae]
MLLPAWLAIAGLAMAGLGAVGGCASRATSVEQVARDEALRRQQAAEASQAQAVPDDRGLYLSLIRKMQDKRMYYASLAHIDAFQKRYGAADDIALLRADALRATGQGDAAVAVYRALERGDTAARALNGIGLVEASRGRFDLAVPALREAVTHAPTDVSLLNDLGYALLLQGDLAGARVPVAQAAELAPGNHKVMSNFVLYLLLNGQAQAADAVIARSKLPSATVLSIHAVAARLSAPNALAAAGAEGSAHDLPPQSPHSAPRDTEYHASPFGAASDAAMPRTDDAFQDGDAMPAPTLHSASAAASGRNAFEPRDAMFDTPGVLR